MVGELLDFTRGRLGGGIPVVRGEGDLLALVRDVINEVGAAWPRRTIQMRPPGHLDDAPVAAAFDAARLSQALANLISNAVQHGSGGS